MYRFRHPKIQDALRMLPEVVASSREASTIKTYIYAYQRFERWAHPIEELSIFPSNDLATSIYVLSLIQLGKSMSSIDQFLCASSWLHRTAGYLPPTNSNLVRTVREGAKRRLARPVVQKEPITPEILKELHSSLIDKKNNMNLYNHRLMTMALLSYAGFFRYDEVSHLRREDVAFHTSYVAIFIQKAKNDVYREGHTVLIARTGSELDPYLSLMKYCDLANIKPKDSCFLFRNVIYHKKKNMYTLHKQDKPLSYTRARELLLFQLAKIGRNPKLFGLHSLRAGGATQAANAGVQDRLFQRHGRWRSTEAKDRYVKDSVLRKLRVTLNLGI